MLFSLFCNVDTLGEVRYGLACSNIIDSTSTTMPLIPLVIYTLLGNTSGPAQLRQPAFTIPPILTPVIQDSKVVTRSRFRKFASSISPVCMPKFWRGANLKKKVIIHTHTLSGAVSKSFVLYREPDVSESVTSPVRSIGPLTAPFTRPNERIRQTLEDPLASNASLVPFDRIGCEISLSECVGHGAAGQVFIGTIDNEKYAVKIALWKEGKQMLRREADIYKVLLDLQG
jgi:hypothetical protein